jgi:hypothetical protein
MTLVTTSIAARQRTEITPAVQAEWIKLSTLRSSVRTIVGAVVIAVGLGTAVVASQVANWNQMTAQQHHDFDPVLVSLIGLLFASVMLGALGVRTVTSEYSTGMIRTTFAATPARQVVVVAKALVVAAVAFPVTLFCNVAGFAIGQRLLSSRHVQAGLNAHSVRAIVLGAAVGAVVAVMGVGLGLMMRRTAAAVTTLSTAMIGGALFGQLLPTSVGKFLPAQCAQEVVSTHHVSGALSPVAAFTVLAVTAVVTLGAGALRVSRP